MITHFADLRLNTVSLQGVRQFYGGLLEFPISFESDIEIRFQATEFDSLTFVETFEPVSPAHCAFEVPFSAFSSVVAFLKDEARIPLLRWPDGREIDDFGTGINAYFRDGDGHLLEVISHPYIQEGILSARGRLKTLYLREVGFPVNSVPEFREWMAGMLGMKLAKVYDDFTFAVGGTAHAVLVSKRRRWIPVQMIALPPSMTVSFGVDNRDTLDRIRERLSGEAILSSDPMEFTISRSGYRIRFVATDIARDIPVHLRLPLSIE